ncbi:MAG: ATP-binding cassette domain-containing protein [Zavarzinella sp.]
MDSQPLIDFRQATLARPGSGEVLHQLNWQLQSGQQWAITGAAGAGKSTFTAAIQGKLLRREGETIWPLWDRLRAKNPRLTHPGLLFTEVSFKEDSRRFRYDNLYYQQRFEFSNDADIPTVGAFLGDWPAEQLLPALNQVGLSPDLLSHPLIHLSNGQTRRARIARALLMDRPILIFDNPLVGLDVAGKQAILDVLHHCHRSGRQMLLIVAPEDIPDWITHVLHLEDGRIAQSCAKSSYIMPNSSAELLTETAQEQSEGPPIVELRDVTIRYGQKTLLSHINWTIHAGERWALVGPNGSGKSTLLSVIAGDQPQAFSNHVVLFGRKRGTGETIWEAKRPIGLVSPEIHLYFRESLPGWQVIATGFYDQMTFRPISAPQLARVLQLMAEFQCTELENRRFRELSTGQQRLLLILRALVKSPPLVIMDEPFQGLDATLIARCKSWLDNHLQPEQALLFVTHRAEEIPTCVKRTLHLDGGRIVKEN